MPPKGRKRNGNESSAIVNVTTVPFGAITIKVHEPVFTLSMPGGEPIIRASSKKLVTFKTCNSYLNELLDQEGRWLEVLASDDPSTVLTSKLFEFVLTDRITRLDRVDSQHKCTIQLKRNFVILTIAQANHIIELTVNITYDDFTEELCQMLLDAYDVKYHVSVGRHTYNPIYAFDYDNIKVNYIYHSEVQLLTGITLDVKSPHPLSTGQHQLSIMLIHECEFRQLSHFTQLLHEISNRITVENRDVYYDGVICGNLVAGQEGYTSIAYEIKKRFMAEIMTKSKNAMSALRPH